MTTIPEYKMKLCSRCGEPRNVDCDFYLRRGRPLTTLSKAECKACTKKRTCVDTAKRKKSQSSVKQALQSSRVHCDASFGGTSQV